MELYPGKHTKHRNESTAVLPKEARERKYDPQEEFDQSQFVLDAVPLLLKPSSEVLISNPLALTDGGSCSVHRHRMPVQVKHCR